MAELVDAAAVSKAFEEHKKYFVENNECVRTFPLSVSSYAHHTTRAVAAVGFIPRLPCLTSFRRSVRPPSLCLQNHNKEGCPALPGSTARSRKGLDRPSQDIDQRPLHEGDWLR